MAVNKSIFTRHSITMSHIVKKKLTAIAAKNNCGFNELIVLILKDFIKSYEKSEGIVEIELEDNLEIDSRDSDISAGVRFKK